MSQIQDTSADEYIHVLEGRAQQQTAFSGTQVSKDQLKEFPYNCIAYLASIFKHNWDKDKIMHGTCFFISEDIALTSAHSLMLYQQGVFHHLKQSYVYQGLNGQINQSTKKIRVAARYIPKQYIQGRQDDRSLQMKIRRIQQQIRTIQQKLRQSKAQLEDAKREKKQKSDQLTPFDFAFLKLEKNTKLTQFPTLSFDFEQQNKFITVCGYPFIEKNDSQKSLQHNQYCNSGRLFLESSRGKYQLKTCVGFSGSPIFYMDGNKCNVVGIHKGKIRQSSYKQCTLLTSMIKDQLQIWRQQMGIKSKQYNHIDCEYLYKKERESDKQKINKLEKQLQAYKKAKKDETEKKNQQAEQKKDQEKKKEHQDSSQSTVHQSNQKQQQQLQSKVKKFLLELIHKLQQSQNQLKCSRQKIKQLEWKVSKLQKEKKYMSKKYQQINMHFGMIKPVINSKVLLLKGTVQQDFYLIKKHLGNPSQLNLIFRASQHQFSSKAFHTQCDDIKDTLILVRTEFGKTIVGYSHYGWRKHQGKQIRKKQKQNELGEINDGLRKAFLLQLDQKVKLVPQLSNGIICCQQKYGPRFGWDSLSICDKCDQLTNSTTWGIGGKYNSLGTRKYDWRSQQTAEAMSGATSGHTFKVIEYEVYSVHWDDKNRIKFYQTFQEINQKVQAQFTERKLKKQCTQYDKYCIERKQR